MDKSKPNRAQLIKAERILNDIEGGLFKLIDIFGYKEHQALCSFIRVTRENLREVNRYSIEKYSDEICWLCCRPVFNPVWYEHPYNGKKPFHKRCLVRYEQLRKRKGSEI